MTSPDLHFTRTATIAAKGAILNTVARPKRGEGSEGEKGKQACLRIRVADDPGHLTDAIIGTVELDCKESLVPVSFSAKLDSGSQRTAITCAVFNQSFPRDILQQCSQSLINFDVSPVNCVQGYVITKVHFEGCTCQARVYALDNMCTPVVGRDLMTHSPETAIASSATGHGDRSSASRGSTPLRPFHQLSATSSSITLI